MTNRFIKDFIVMLIVFTAIDVIWDMVLGNHPNRELRAIYGVGDILLAGIFALSWQIEKVFKKPDVEIVIRPTKNITKSHKKTSDTYKTLPSIRRKYEKN